MSLLLATQITAVATAVLAGFAIVTAVFALLAFRKQSAEVTALQQQLKDQKDLNEKQTPVLKLQAQELQESLAERQRDRELRHRDQATRVFPWTGVASGSPKLYYVQVHNASDRPVYNLNVTLHGLRGAEPASYSFDDQSVTALMPGQTVRIPAENGVQWDAPTGPGGVWSKAWFHDANEVHWTVTSKGEITELP